MKQSNPHQSLFGIPGKESAAYNHNQLSFYLLAISWKCVTTFCFCQKCPVLLPQTQWKRPDFSLKISQLYCQKRDCKCPDFSLKNSGFVANKTTVTSSVDDILFCIAVKCFSSCDWHRFVSSQQRGIGPKLRDPTQKNLRDSTQWDEEGSTSLLYWFWCRDW